MLCRAISSRASKAGLLALTVMGASVAMSDTGRLMSRFCATTRLRRSRSVIRPNSRPCSTSNTDETRRSRINAAVAWMVVSGARVMGARLIRLRMGVPSRFKALLDSLTCCDGAACG